VTVTVIWSASHRRPAVPGCASGLGHLGWSATAFGCEFRRNLPPVTIESRPRLPLASGKWL